MAWLLVILLLAFIALLVTSTVLGPPPTGQQYSCTEGYVQLATLACFVLLQIMLVVGVCSAHAKHNRHRR